MRKVTFLMAALILAWMAAACSETNPPTSNNGTNQSANSNETGSGSSGSGEEPVTLRMAWWGSEPRHNYTLEVIQRYEEANPHITIEPEYSGWDEYWQKLGPQAAANELPDIIQMDLSYIAQYGENNQLADLTPFLGKEIDTTNISDSVISGGMVGDQLFGFNLGVNALGFHYDAEKLESLGVAPLPEAWTWDDYYAKAKEVKDAGDVYFDTGMKADVFFNYFLRTKGASLYGADGISLGYEDDALFVEFFTPLVELVQYGAVPTPDVAAQFSNNLEMNPVVMGEGIGVWQWSNQFVGLQQVANRPMKIHPMPGPHAEQGLYLKPSMFFSISENSQQKEEAAKFINFFVNDIEANQLINGERGVPGSSVVKDALKPSLTEQQAQVFDYISWAEENSSPLGGPDPIGAGEVIALLDDLAEQMNFGVLSPEDAAQQFREEATKILSKNQ